MSKSIVIWATMKVRMMAITGSSFFFVPLPKIDKPGSKLSRATACRSFAAPISPIRDEKNDVANSPSKIRGADRLVYRRADEPIHSLMRIGEFVAYVLDNISVAIERVTGYRSGHDNDYQSVSKECQPKPGECSFGYSFTRVLEVSGHASAPLQKVSQGNGELNEVILTRKFLL